MRVLSLVIACLASTVTLAKKSSRRATQSSSSRSSSAYAASNRSPKLSYADWDNPDDDDNYKNDYFAQDNNKSNRSPSIKDDFGADDYTTKYTTKRPQHKRKSRTATEEQKARSEGTFSGAGKGPLYDAYNQLHTLAQVRSQLEENMTNLL